MPPRIAVRDISFFERQIPFTKPFRFGAVVINAAAQAFVRVEVEVEGKSTSMGASAELMAPKWFDKRAQLSPEQTVGELRRSLTIASAPLVGRDGVSRSRDLPDGLSEIFFQKGLDKPICRDLPVVPICRSSWGASATVRRMG